MGLFKYYIRIALAKKNGKGLNYYGGYHRETLIKAQNAAKMLWNEHKRKELNGGRDVLWVEVRCKGDVVFKYKGRP